MFIKGVSTQAQLLPQLLNSVYCFNFLTLQTPFSWVNHCLLPYALFCIKKYCGAPPRLCNPSNSQLLVQSWLDQQYSLYIMPFRVHLDAAPHHMLHILTHLSRTDYFRQYNPNTMSCLFHFDIDQHRIFYKHLENFHYQQCHRTIQLHMRYICLKLVKARTQKCSSKNRMGNLRMLEVCWFLNSTRRCLLHKVVQFSQEDKIRCSISLRGENKIIFM